MTTVKSQAAQVLFPVLSVFHAVGDQTLVAVWKVFAEGSLDKLVFEFGGTMLSVAVDGDDDSIELTTFATAASKLEGAVKASHLPPWSDFIGTPFGWGWLTVNQQGYCDGVLLSFGNIHPVVMLNVVASSIKVINLLIAAES